MGNDDKTLSDVQKSNDDKEVAGMVGRSKEGYKTFLSQFVDLVYVVCPSCKKQAVVDASSPEMYKIKLTCLRCGYNKVARTTTVNLGLAVDPYFGLPLWLVSSSGTNKIWAYNYEHLRFLRSHIEAKIRERNTHETFNSSLGSRLPKWMLAKKNRAEILKSIVRLEKLNGDGR
jgi:hypothetical protein